MLAWSRERALLGVLLTVHVTVMVVVLGFVMGWWSSGGSGAETTLAPASETAAGPGLDGPTVTPEGSLFLVTATPGHLTPSTIAPDGEPPPSPTEALQPTDTPEPTPAPEPTLAPTMPPSPAQADFTGRWRITDIVTEGSNMGEVYTFDVSLEQSGDQVFGGNSGIRIRGTVEGDTATLSYEQPALGYTGTFVWTMVGTDQAAGTFTSSFPNSGTSTLQRLQ